jgi:hypothetical protein
MVSSKDKNWAVGWVRHSGAPSVVSMADRMAGYAVVQRAVH